MSFAVVTDSMLTEMEAMPGWTWIEVEQWSRVQKGEILLPEKSETQQRSSERIGRVVKIHADDAARGVAEGDRVTFRYMGGQSFKRESGNVLLVVPAGNVELVLCESA